MTQSEPSSSTSASAGGQTNPNVAIVIPFFQRRPGILRRALTGVDAQIGIARDRLHVIVVDDASPVSPDDEIRGFDQRLRIEVLRRPNGGPGAARNYALDAIDPNTEYVAFLDSDDVWESEHLVSAVSLLDSTGASFFFSNFYQLRAEISAFERAGKLKLEEHEHLGRDIYRYSGDMSAQILTGNLIGTSTVVFRFPAHRSLRFHTAFRRAGEDYLMWLDFWAHQASFVFRTTPSVRYFEGVNIYSGVNWGSVDLVERTSDEIRFLNEALTKYDLSRALKEHVERRLAGHRRFRLQALRGALVRMPFRTAKYLARNALGTRIARGEVSNLSCLEPAESRPLEQADASGDIGTEASVSHRP